MLSHYMGDDMEEKREAELIAHVPTLGTLDEALEFRLEITRQEPMSARLFQDLTRRIDYLAAKEGKR